jgi:hypothetical protein
LDLPVTAADSNGLRIETTPASIAISVLLTIEVNLLPASVST